MFYFSKINNLGILLKKSINILLIDIKLIYQITATYLFLYSSIQLASACVCVYLKFFFINKPKLIKNFTIFNKKKLKNIIKLVN